MRTGPEDPTGAERRRPARRRPAPVAAATLAAVLLGACAGDRPDGEASAGGPAPERGAGVGDRAVVVVSVPPLAWFVERLAGDRAEIAVLVPPGASPATHEPTSRQMRAVTRADLYVAVGHPAFPFEAAWMDALTAANPTMRVVRAAERCDVIPDDPHVWLSTTCAGRMAPAVATALAGTVDAPSAELEERRRALSAAVDSVAAGMGRRLGPHRGGAFLVLHPSLGYVAREFGLRQLAVARGLSGPGAAGLGEVVRTARDAGIHTVLVQPQFSEEAARAVAAELPEGRVARVDPLARDWPTAMVEIAARIAASFRPPDAAAAERSAPGGGAGPGPAASRR